MPAEEPQAHLQVTEEVVETPEVAPDASTPAADAAPPEPSPDDAAAKLDALPGILREAFEGDLDEDELDSIAGGLKADDLRKLPPNVRATLRAIVKRDVAADKVRADRDAAWEAQKTTSLAKFESDQKALRKREAALLAIAASPSAADPGKAPEIDPFTPEGQAAMAKFHAQKGISEAFGPLRQEERVARETAFWDDLQDKFPDLRDQKTADEFGAFVAEMNKGIDPEAVRQGREKPRVGAGLAAELFFNRREKDKLQREATERTTREASDRAESARAIGRASHGGVPNLLGRYDALRKQDEDAAFELLESNPSLRKAVLERNGIRA